MAVYSRKYKRKPVDKCKDHMPLKLLLLPTIGCGRQRKLKIESLLANILVKKRFNVPSFLSFSLWLFSVYILLFAVSWL